MTRFDSARAGDYFIWLAQDFRYGTFGHPWEPSLCVFGEELLAAVAEIGDEAFGRILRRNGRPTRVVDAALEPPGRLKITTTEPKRDSPPGIDRVAEDLDPATQST